MHPTVLLQSLFIFLLLELFGASLSFLLPCKAPSPTPLQGFGNKLIIPGRPLGSYRTDICIKLYAYSVCYAEAGFLEASDFCFGIHRKK